jgi:phosphohistidine phosphatase SixA
MTDPPTGLRPRLQLAPLLVPLLLLLAAGAGMLVVAWWARTAVVVLVPHAEAGLSDTGDPDLSTAGESRARRLGSFLAEALAGRPVDHLYAANSRRSQQTAVSVANQFKLPINLLGSSDWGELAGRLRREHRGATVVVIGPAATLRGLAERLGTAALPLEDDDHASVFVLVLPRPGEGRLLWLRYGEAVGKGPPRESPAVEKPTATS